MKILYLFSCVVGLTFSLEGNVLRNQMTEMTYPLQAGFNTTYVDYNRQAHEQTDRFLYPTNENKCILSGCKCVLSTSMSSFPTYQCDTKYLKCYEKAKCKYKHGKCKLKHKKKIKKCKHKMRHHHHHHQS